MSPRWDPLSHPQHPLPYTEWTTEMESFLTAVALHRVRIAQEADQHIAQFLSLGQRMEPPPPCVASRREPVMDAAAIRWWDRAAQRCAGDRGAARECVKEPLVGAKANVLRFRRGLHQLRSHGARSRATLIAERRLGLLQLRRACAVWRSHGKLAAALHTAAGELRARAQAEHRRLGCSRGWRRCSASAGVRGMWRGTWRTRRDCNARCSAGVMTARWAVRYGTGGVWRL